MAATLRGLSGAWRALVERRYALLLGTYLRTARVLLEWTKVKVKVKLLPPKQLNFTGWNLLNCAGWRRFSWPAATPIHPTWTNTTHRFLALFLRQCRPGKDIRQTRHLGRCSERPNTQGPVTPPVPPSRQVYLGSKQCDICVEDTRELLARAPNLGLRVQSI